MNRKNITKICFGQRIKRLRLEAGMSQEMLADKCGLDRTYISGIERGVRNPTLEVICILANGLSTDLSTLFSFDIIINK